MRKWYSISRKKRRFLFKNLGKGLLWFLGLVIVFVLFKRYVPINEEFLDKLYDQPMLVYLVFAISEIVVGIIPPEIFFVWALKKLKTLFQMKILIQTLPQPC